MEYFMRNTAGVAGMTEQAVAADLLASAKTAIRDTALAISETATPEVRNVLKKHLSDAITAHERITDFMMGKGYYSAYDPKRQFSLDMRAAETVLSLRV